MHMALLTVVKGFSVKGYSSMSSDEKKYREGEEATVSVRQRWYHANGALTHTQNHDHPVLSPPCMALTPEHNATWVEGADGSSVAVTLLLDVVSVCSVGSGMLSPIVESVVVAVMRDVNTRNRVAELKPRDVDCFTSLTLRADVQLPSGGVVYAAILEVQMCRDSSVLGTQPNLQRVFEGAVKAMLEYKTYGNEYAATGAWEQAAACYRHGLRIAEAVTRRQHISIGEERTGAPCGCDAAQLRDIVLTLLLNLSQAYLADSKCGNSTKATVMRRVVQHCDKALNLCQRKELSQPVRHKALYRKGKALAAMDETESAEVCFRTILSEDAANVDAQRELSNIRSAMGKQKEALKAALKGAF